MRRALVIGLVSLVLTSLTAAAAEQPGLAEAMKPFRFLVGDWTGRGGSKAEQGMGAFSFQFELQGTVLVRRNVADYPATAQKPSVHHEDLMVIYSDPETKSLQAMYFDNEPHVIHYAVEVSPDGDTLTFVSDEAGAQPRFRLTYHKTGANTLSGKFEIAPPGKADEFANYMEWTARRKGRK
ncbi:MAG: hypothetical protein LAO03_14290 [Acidobacteriia bacterium]|nr:hypothetical protein [Terriglobia bacterium]